MSDQLVLSSSHHLFIFQLICDELSISKGDKEKIHPNSEESELEKTLKIISDNCYTAWVVLAASSLFDEDGGGAVPEDSLERLAERSGYKAVRLKNVMRHSSSISSALDPDTLGTCNTLINIKKLISVGYCSTVTGIKPTWYLYEYTENNEDPNFVNYEEIAKCVKSYLETKKSEKIVILCDWGVSPTQLKRLLKPDTLGVTLYDAGVEEFCYDSKPCHYTADLDLDKQRKDLVKWIQGEVDGVLVTHDVMYRGCEAETIVFISDRWGGEGRQARSGPTRAVSQLCLVTSDFFKINEGGKINQEIKQYFDLVYRRC